MKSAAIPENEQERLQRVIELGILDTAPEERFDAITREAVQAFRVPIATITIIDEKREWYKSCQGLDAKVAAREVSFCAHAMLARLVFVVEDTLKDARFADNPMVTGKPFIRFYAGVSLRDKNGLPIGVFCIKDTKPRELSADELTLLLAFADRASTELNRNT